MNNNQSTKITLKDLSILIPSLLVEQGKAVIESSSLSESVDITLSRGELTIERDLRVADAPVINVYYFIGARPEVVGEDDYVSRVFYADRESDRAEVQKIIDSFLSLVD